jgi:hypothetical protein
MSAYYLVEVADDGTPSITVLTDPVQVTQEVSIPLASLLPAPAPPPATDIPAVDTSA